MNGKQRAVTLTTIFALTSSLLIGPAAQFVTPAYGHGLSGDVAMPASIGDRVATVRVDMKPSFLLAEAPQDATIEIKFFDTKTNSLIEHVTYFVTLKKGENVLMREWFHAHDGDLFIKIRPTEQPNVVVNAPKEPILDGWIGSRDVPALAQGPIFLEGGLYHFAIEIFAIDFDKTILEPPIKYDAYISIGETTTYAITNGVEEVISVRTYYDKIQDFSFDEKNKHVKFSMPMNWDEEFLAQVPLLHEEVVIPKSFTELVAEKYTGLVNGVRLPKSAVMVDDSNPNELVVHYMIPNQQLLQIRKHVTAMVDGDVKTAEFTLAPGTIDIGVPLESEQMMGGQMMAMSSNGSINAMLSWSPTVIEPDKTAAFTFNFMDALSNQPIRDATYDFLLVKDGQEIIKRQGQTLAGVGSEQFTFTQSQTGSVMLRLDNVNDTGESIEFSINVVPEFAPSVLAIMAGVIATMLLITRFKHTNFGH
ncbi:MAG: hypothetical protein ACE5J2_00140 [Nitrososphaerales archaeon]